MPRRALRAGTARRHRRCKHSVSVAASGPGCMGQRRGKRGGHGRPRGAGPATAAPLRLRRPMGLQLWLRSRWRIPACIHGMCGGAPPQPRSRRCLRTRRGLWRGRPGGRQRAACRLRPRPAAAHGDLAAALRGGRAPGLEDLWTGLASARAATTSPWFCRGFCRLRWYDPTRAAMATAPPGPTYTPVLETYSFTRAFTGQPGACAERNVSMRMAM